jgi:hypothetical protein
MQLKKFSFLSIFAILLFSCTKNTNTIQPTQKVGFNNQVAAIVAANPKKFLFDATKAETAGNADWVIDEDNSNPQKLPTPLIATITSTTSETYWTGALSSWGIALAKLGHTVETLPTTGGTITYGSTTNPQDLSKYNVFVVDEPNIRFTTAEKKAIINFVYNGGGLCMISDHTVSDRNNDGWDSPAIWNDLMTNNTLISNPFKFKYDLTNFSQTTTNVTAVANTITNGSQGIATSLKYNNGASMTLTSGGVSKGLFWKTGTAKTSLTNVMAAYSTYGTGRIFSISDSSPADDGTGAPGNTLYFGWSDLSGNHARLHMNASLWLAKLQ